MAKTRRRYRNYRKSTKWSANLTNILGDEFNAGPNSQFQFNSTLCSNPSQAASMVSTVYTVKNVEFNGTITIYGQSPTPNGINDIEDITAYVMYVPQGMTVGPQYAQNHPEYILAMKYYGKPQFNNNSAVTFQNPLRIKTRLGRKLQTGDSIILLITGFNVSTASIYGLRYSGITRWWSKSN